MSKRKQDNRGRSVGGSRYVKLDCWLFDCAAYRSLSVYSRNLYWEIKRRYTGTNNGNIIMSHREAEISLGCSNRPVLAAFRELQEKGFILPQQKGSFTWKNSVNGNMRATTWVITEEPVDYPEKSLIPTKDFMKWKP